MLNLTFSKTNKKKKKTFPRHKLVVEVRHFEHCVSDWCKDEAICWAWGWTVLEREREEQREWER